MYIPAKLVLKSYMPKQLEKGMLFITKIHQNTLKEYVEIWQLDKVPIEPLEEFIIKHGAPVEPCIIDDEDGEIVAESSEIGWWDDGEESDEYRDISLIDINKAIREWDGLISLLVEEDEEEEEDLEIVTLQGKVVLADISAALDEEEELYEEEDPGMCSACNGTGEDVGEYPCSICKGTGADNQSDWFKSRYDRNYGREE